jgi:Cd2+/Zn2+-exporting ATPase
LLAVAASVERRSEHPLAQAVVNAALDRGLPLADVANPEALTGRGMRARLDQATVWIGNAALFQEQGITIPDAARHAIVELSDDGKTTMLVGRSQLDGDVVLGVIGVADTIRPAAREIVGRLKALGVEQTVILTGDTERAARAIARQCGIDDCRSGLLPQQKLEVIADLTQADRSVVMVGDGVNDAPALAVATTGVAMGSAGTDVALETADVVLMSDDLSKLPYVIALSRKTRHVIRQNLTFALAVIAILVVGTLLQITTLSIGVVGHEGSTIIVVANGLRLLRGLPTPADAAMSRRTTVDGARTESSASV